MVNPIIVLLVVIGGVVTVAGIFWSGSTDLDQIKRLRDGTYKWPFHKRENLKTRIVMLIGLLISLGGIIIYFLTR